MFQAERDIASEEDKREVLRKVEARVVAEAGKPLTWSRSANTAKNGESGVLRRERSLLSLWKIWCARRDSNARPLAPEANALSGLSYGRKERREKRLG